MQNFQELLEQKDSLQSEFRSCHPNNSIKAINVVSTPVRLTNFQIVTKNAAC